MIYKCKLLENQTFISVLDLWVKWQQTTKTENHSLLPSIYNLYSLYCAVLWKPISANNKKELIEKKVISKFYPKKQTELTAISSQFWEEKSESWDKTL